MTAIKENGQAGEDVIFGRNPVIEVLRSGREIERVYVAAGSAGSVAKIRGMARDAGVVIDTVPRVVLDRMAQGARHQGVAAEVAAYRYHSVEEILARAAAAGEAPLLLLLDGITDPHNLGAMIRTAECAGAHGILIPKRKACGLTSVVAKASAGAIETLPVARVTNLAQMIAALQEKGIWVAAVDMGGELYYAQEERLRDPLALVIGSEGRGIGRLVRERCDYRLSIPLMGSLSSLNAASAAAVVLYAVRRARQSDFTP